MTPRLGVAPSAGASIFGRVEQVLARIEAGAGRDLDDLLELRERCMEFFKVVSRGRVPEVWLLVAKQTNRASDAIIVQ